MHIIMNVDLHRIVGILKTRNRIEITEPESTTFRYFDTFDWLLYHDDHALIDQNREAVLRRYATFEPELVLKLRTKSKLKFWWEFPEGGLKLYLQTIIGPRALLPIFDARRTSRAANILNEDGKTVLRIIEEEYALNSKPDIVANRYLRLEALRGYEEEYEKCKLVLLEHGVLLATDVLPLLTRLLQAIGKQPGDYVAKPQFHLDESMPTPRALQHILSALLYVMETNTDGIRNDLDTEFLHDYRVAGRTARCVITELKKFLPPQTVSGLRDYFKTLGTLTNSLRDLDVYLLAQDEFKALLPESLHPGFERYFAELKKRRRAEWVLVKNQLESEAYKTCLANLKTHLIDDLCAPAELESAAALPIGISAKTAIRKRFKVIVKTGLKLTDQSPDPEYHVLRIECKKLRYLLELFSSLFEPKTLDEPVKHLKRLQSVLGNFNDCALQQRDLEGVLTESKPQSKHHSEIAAAIGGLITHLYRQKSEARSSFKEAFQAFSSQSMTDLFESLPRAARIE